MNVKTRNNPNRKREAGFAVLEAIIVIVVIGLVVGGGFWVSRNRQQSYTTQNETTQTTEKLESHEIGTLSGLEKLDSFDLKGETLAEDELANQELADAEAQAEAEANLAEGYNVAF